MYVTPEALNTAVTESQQAGRISDEFARILMRIVKGVAQRFQFPPDDLYSDTFVSVADHLHEIDTTRNVFNFLTTTVINHFKCRWRERKQYRKTFSQLITDDNLTP